MRPIDINDRMADNNNIFLFILSKLIDCKGTAYILFLWCQMLSGVNIWRDWEKVGVMEEEVSAEDGTDTKQQLCVDGGFVE